VTKVCYALLVITTLMGCSTLEQEQAINLAGESFLVVVDDPRPSRLRSFSAGPAYGAPIAYDKDPVLSRYSRQIAGDHGVEVLTEWPLKSIGVHCFVIASPSANTLAGIESDPRVRWVQPFNNHYVKHAEHAIKSNPDQSNPAWLPVGGDGAGIRVTVIDTGADLSHRDLQGGRIEYENFAGNRGLGQDEYHGTSVLGLIAATPDSNETVVEGLLPAARVQHLRACWEENKRGVCNTLTLALALDAATQWQPHVLNLSLSGPRDRVLDELVSALTRQGTIIVSAYDEKRDFDNRFPSPGGNVIYAQGGEQIARHPEFSNTFIAPEHALSLSPMNAYELVSGHSIAAPYITSLLARITASDPVAAPDAAIARLQQELAP
jgi:subtilisin family serine protease